MVRPLQNIKITSSKKRKKYFKLKDYFELKSIGDMEKNLVVI